MWRFCKIWWPSQNIWTLKKILVFSPVINVILFLLLFLSLIISEINSIPSYLVASFLYEIYFYVVSNNLSVGSTETKYIKLDSKTKFFNITFDFCIYFNKENFFFSFCFLVPPVKVYKNIVKFSFTQQKIFWVLEFSFMYLVSVDPMDRSLVP